MLTKYGYSTTNQVTGASRQIALPALPNVSSSYPFKFIVSAECFGGDSRLFFLFCCEAQTADLGLGVPFDAIDYNNYVLLGINVKYEVYQTVPGNSSWEDSQYVLPTIPDTSLGVVCLALQQYVYWTNSSIMNLNYLFNYSAIAYSCTSNSIVTLQAPNPYFEVGYVELTSLNMTSGYNIEIIQNTSKRPGLYGFCLDAEVSDSSARLVEFKLYEGGYSGATLVATNSTLLDPAYKFFISTFELDKTIIGTKQYWWTIECYMNSSGYLTSTGARSGLITVTVVPMPEEQNNQHNFIQGWLMGQKLDIFNPGNKKRAWVEEQEDCLIIYQVEEAQNLNPYLEVT